MSSESSWGNLPVPPDPSTGPLRGRALVGYADKSRSKNDR